MAIILDGKKLRDKLLDNLKTKVEKLQTKPTLVVILVDRKSVGRERVC